jgi:hypothetical protein
MPQYIESSQSRPIRYFQKNLKKPSKNRKFALGRGFTRLIYARDTESPLTGIEGAASPEISLRAENATQEILEE